MQRTCAELGCRATSTTTRCPTHARARDKTRAQRQPYRKGYATAAYRKARAAAIEAAGRRCTRVIDGRRCLELATEAHHITPLSVDPARYADPSNLAPVCRTHNPRGGAR